MHDIYSTAVTNWRHVWCRLNVSMILLILPAVLPWRWLCKFPWSRQLWIQQKVINLYRQTTSVCSSKDNIYFQIVIHSTCPPDFTLIMHLTSCCSDCSDVYCHNESLEILNSWSVYTTYADAIFKHYTVSYMGTFSAWIQYVRFINIQTKCRNRRLQEAAMMTCQPFNHAQRTH